MSHANSAELHTDPAQFSGVDVYAVTGNPISHSKSPIIHKRFAEQSNQKMHYGRLQPALDEFKTAAHSFFAAGGKGMNVTVPFKLDAQALADVLTPRAQLAGAVNTLRIQDGKIFGDNTDGAGLVRDLLAQGIQIQGSRILLLGAGGASRGVLGPLLEQSPKELIIANRSNAKADELVQLADEFGGFTIGVAAFPDGHPASNGDFDKDVDVLIRKEELGATFATTQFFFEVKQYTRLVEALAARGSKLVIIPGILPVTNVKLLHRMAELGGTPIPAHIADAFAKVEIDPQAVRSLGVEIATSLCQELLAAGAPGLHFYTMNSSTATQEIYRKLNDAQ